MKSLICLRYHYNWPKGKPSGARDVCLQSRQLVVNLFTTEEFKILILFETSANMLTCTRRRLHVFTLVNRAIG